jgi:uncharacterized membrane protein YfcA
MSIFETLLAILAVLLGALVQGVTGVGAGFVSVPGLALIDPTLIPGPLIFGSLALSMTMAVRGRADLDSEMIPVIAAGIVPGAFVGAWLLSRIPLDRAGLLFGFAILFVVGLSAIGIAPRLTRTTGFAAGAVSAVLGTCAGIGGPVLALLYQDVSGPRLRATLALLYSLASCIMLVILHGFDRFGRAEIVAGAWLMPGFVLGYLVSSRLTPSFDQGRSRIGVLCVSGVAAMVLVIRSLV